MSHCNYAFSLLFDDPDLRVNSLVEVEGADPSLGEVSRNTAASQTGYTPGAGTGCNLRQVEQGGAGLVG